MHWTRRVGILCLGLFSLGLGRVCPGQDNIAVNNGGVVYLDDFSGSVFLSNDGGNYLLFHKVVGEGVGHEDGYSRLGVRTRLWEDLDRHIFGEVHALITDDARIGFNIGGGARKQVGGGILGIHGWFDDYETGQENRYRQITGGFEYLHPIFDIRSNVYVPIDETETFVGIVNQGTDLSFLGNNLVTAGTIATERAYYGWDLEGGGPVPLAENWLRAYGGIYQLLFEGDTTTGFRARAEARFMEGVNLNLMVSEDDKYGTNVNLGVEVRFRGTMPTRFQSGLLADRRYDQVRRVWPVQTQVENVGAALPVTNPGTDDPIQIVFVDNTNSGGSGTFEDPFEMLPSGDADADIFLVDTGSGSTFGNISLFDGQQILGAGKPHMIDTEQLGVVQLPSEFNQVSGNFPTLESTISTPIITLANDNVVRGFNLIGENGIAGDAVDNFLLECLHSDVIENGIVISNATGMGIVRDVDFAVMSGGTGVSVTNSTAGGQLNVAISEVEIDGGASGIVVAGDGGDVMYSIDNIEVVNTTVAGLTLAGTDGALIGTVDGTVAGDVNGTILDDNFGNGVLVQLDNATGTSTFTGLEASGNGTMGMDLDGVKIVAENMSNYTVNIFDSTIDGAMDDGIDSSADESVLVLNVDPTSIVDSVDNALEFTASNDSLFTANFVEVDMADSLNDAINGMVLSSSNATLNFAQFDASGSTGDGVDVVVQDGSSLTAIFDNSDDTTTFLDTTNGFSNSDSSAINVDVSDDSNATLIFTDINADNLAADGGVNLIASMNSQISSSWTNGSISDGDATGVTLDADGAGSGIVATFTNVAIDRNAGDGIDASLTGGNASSVLGVVLNSVTLNENMNGLDYEINGSQAMGGIIFNEADLSNNNLDAFQFDVTGGAILQADTTVPMIPGTIVNDFSNSGSNAFQGTVNGTGSRAVINISDALAENSGEEGALFDNTFSGQLVFNYTNGSLNMSGFDGLSTNTESGALTSLSLDTVTLDNNGQLMTVTQGNGLVATVDGVDSRFDLMLNDVSTSSNFEKGLSITTSNSSNVNPLVTDPMTMAMSRVTNTGTFVSTLNQEEGFYFDVQSGSTLAFNSVLGTTSNNGLGGNFSGFRGLVDGAGSAATVSFDNFSSNANTQDGFEFDVTNGGMFIGEVLSTLPVAPAFGQLSSASNNMGAGITLNAAGANTVAALIMDGNNQVNNNMEEGLIVTATDIEQLAIQASGQFNMNQGGDGIHITGTNVTTSAIEVGGGVSSASVNFEDGVDITISNSTMMDIDVTTLTQTATVESFNVSELTANMNNGNGVSFDANMVTLPEGAISDVTANGNLGDGMGADGDGIRVFFTDSTITDFSINGNGAELNQNNGINVELTGTDSTGLSIIDNVGAVPNVGINFLIDGSTGAQPFFVTNTSAFGFDITSFNLNLAPINFGFGPVFNTVGQGSQVFTPQFNTDLVTGLSAVNGMMGPNFSTAVLDGSQLLDIDFSDFNPSETFVFDIDLNANAFSTSNVVGNNLIDGAVSVDFNNGSTLFGTLQAVAGNPDAATFVANTISRPNTGMRMNGENGIRFSASESNLTNTDISNNITSNNNELGIDIVIDSLSTIDGMTINDNNVDANMMGGISVDISDTMITNGLQIDGNTISQSMGNGLDTDFSGATAVDLLDISNNTVTESTGEGISVTSTTTTFGGITADGNISQLSAGGDGLLFDMTGSAVTGTLTVSNGLFDQNTGNGLEFDLDGTPIANLQIVDNFAQIMMGTAVDFDVQANPVGHYDILNLMMDPLITLDMLTLDFAPAGLSFAVTSAGGTEYENLDGNANITGLQTVNGVVYDPTVLDQPGVVMEGGTTLDFIFNDFQGGEVYDHFDVELTAGMGTIFNPALLAGTTASATFSDGDIQSGVFNTTGSLTMVAASLEGGFTMNTENGVLLTAANGSDIGILNIDNNTSDSNGLGGIVLDITDSTLPGPGAPGTVNNNILTNNMNGDGISLLTPDTNGTPIGLNFTDNTITDNIGGSGINIALDTNAGGLTSEISGNTISNNENFGVRIDAIDDVDLNLTIGDSMGNANVIDGNTDAGVAITMMDDVTSTITVQNTTISNTTNGTDVDFAGQGLAIRLMGNAELTGLTIGDVALMNTTISGNSSNEIEISATQNAVLTDPTIQNVMVDGDNTAGDGLNFVRSGNATVDNVSILTSTFSNNNGDGIDITAGISDTTDEFLIMGNTIDSNARGISLFTRFSADIDADIFGNMITNNSSDGIQLTEFAPNILDTATITAGIMGNTITGNGGSGVDVMAAHDLSIDSNTIDGNDDDGITLAALRFNLADQTEITNNLSISNNGADGTGFGINIAIAGEDVLIQDNLAINGNASGGISSLLGSSTSITGNDISMNTGDGIQIVNGVHTIDGNTITENTGDGIELISNDTMEAVDLEVNSVGGEANIVSSNEGRGLNLLVQGTTVADVDFSDDTFEDNTLEGVYVVNTASTTQSVDAPATNALASNGSVFATPELVFNFDNNDVLINGTGSGFAGTGLVIRVGTSGALMDPMAYEDPAQGGFASDGSGMFTVANLSGRGGVLANITNNNIASLPGADVLFESFVSTANPGVTIGTWDSGTTTYDIAAFTQDPLARFDLNFTGNTGGDTDVVRDGASFTSNEDEFKSRDMTQTNPGPFDSGTRLRNAQRQADRSAPFLNPVDVFAGTAGDPNDFQYSGVGESTFRRTGLSTTVGFGAGDDFTDTESLGAGIGELPFGWGTF